MKLIKTGATRWVLLTDKYAIKFPNPTRYRNFLQGILANEQETVWYKELGHLRRLCPVLFTSWLRLILVMPRVEVCTDDDIRLLAIDIDNFLKIHGRGEAERYPAEKKADSFGWLREDIDDKIKAIERLVIIDYGS